MPHIESKNTLIDIFFFENFCLKIQTHVVLKREIRGQIIEFPSSGNVIICISDRLLCKTSCALFILLTVRQN